MLSLVRRKQPDDGTKERNMKLQDYLDELNATLIRAGRTWIVTHIDGRKLSEPKTYGSRREMLSDLEDWWENGWKS